MRDHIEQITMTISDRTLANIITRYFGITDDGGLVVKNADVTTDEHGRIDSFQFEMLRYPVVIDPDGQ